MVPGGSAVDNVIPKKSLGTIGLRRQGYTTNYIPKFQVAKMSLEVAEGRLQVPGLMYAKTHAICLIKCFFAEKLIQFK